MRLDAEKDGARLAISGDNRCTRVGKFIRRTSLDELPQLFNVLRGEMSIVGPRPERPVFVSQFEKQIPRYAERHLVPPGIIGWPRCTASASLASTTSPTSCAAISSTSRTGRCSWISRSA